MVTYRDGSPATLTDTLVHVDGAAVGNGDLRRLHAAWLAGRSEGRRPFLPEKRVITYCAARWRIPRDNSGKMTRGCRRLVLPDDIYCSRHQPGQPTGVS